MRAQGCRCCSGDRVLIQHTESQELGPRYHITRCGGTSCNLSAWEVEREEDQKFRVICGYRVNLRPAW